MRLENVVPVPVSEVERIHEEALERGGATGVLDRNLCSVDRCAGEFGRELEFASDIWERSGC